MQPERLQPDCLPCDDASGGCCCCCSRRRNRHPGNAWPPERSRSRLLLRFPRPIRHPAPELSREREGERERSKEQRQVSVTGSRLETERKRMRGTYALSLLPSFPLLRFPAHISVMLLPPASSTAADHISGRDRRRQNRRRRQERDGWRESLRSRDASPPNACH